MEFPKFYVWRPSIRRGALHVKPVDKGVNVFALLRGNVVFTEPMKFTMGGKPSDVITTELPSIRLISDKIVELFRREGITGWKTYPVGITGKGGVPVTGYHGFAVTGRCVRLIPTAPP